MPRSSLNLLALALTGILYAFLPAGSGVAVSQAASLEIDDFSYLDTSGEPHASALEIKLQAFMTALRRVSRPTIGIISLPPPASHPVPPTDR